MKTIKAKVHMLPTEQAEKCVTIAHKQMFLSPGLVSSGGDIQAYHLYITKDEEIKEGDWILRPDIPELKPHKVCVLDGLSPNCKKIIATTDSELLTCKGVKREGESCSYNNNCKYPSCRLPQIPQHIIEAYVKKPFDKVMVECEEKEVPVAKNTRGEIIYDWFDVPKLNQDGTLAVSLVEEEMYSREEVVHIIKTIAVKASIKGFIPADDLDKWIKENL